MYIHIWIYVYTYIYKNKKGMPTDVTWVQNIIPRDRFPWNLPTLIFFLYWATVSQFFNSRKRCKRWWAFKDKWKMNKEGKKKKHRNNKMSQNSARNYETKYSIYVCTTISLLQQTGHQSGDPVSDTSGLYLLLQTDFLFCELTSWFPESQDSRAEQICPLMELRLDERVPGVRKMKPHVHGRGIS